MNLFNALLNQTPAKQTTSNSSSLISSTFETDMRLDARSGKLHLSAAKTQEFQIGLFGLEELNAVEDATANQEFISNLLEAAKAKGIDAKAVMVVMPNTVAGNKPKYFSNSRLKVVEGEGVASTIETDNNNFNLFAQLSDAVIGVEEDGKPTAIISVLDFNLVKGFTEEELQEQAIQIAEANNLDADTVLKQISTRYHLPYFYNKKSRSNDTVEDQTEIAYVLRNIDLVNVYFVTDVTVVL